MISERKNEYTTKIDREKSDLQFMSLRPDDEMVKTDDLYLYQEKDEIWYATKTPEGIIREKITAKEYKEYDNLLNILKADPDKRKVSNEAKEALLEITSKRNYTLRESDSLKMTNLELDRLRRAVRDDQAKKLQERDDLINTVAYTLGMLNLTEFLKNSFDLPLTKEQRTATYCALTPDEDKDYHRLCIFDNGPGVLIDFLDKDKERKKNELAEYRNILGSYDTIQSPKERGKHLGSTGRGLAQVAKTFEKLERKEIRGSIKIGNIGGDDNPRGAMVIIESKKSNNPDAAKIAEKIFNDIAAEFSERTSSNVSCIPRASSKSSFFSLHLSQTPKSISLAEKDQGNDFNQSPKSLIRHDNIFNYKNNNIIFIQETEIKPLYLIEPATPTPQSVAKSENFEVFAIKKIEDRIEELSMKMNSCCFFSGMTHLENDELDFLLAIENNYKRNANLSACVPAVKPKKFLEFQLSGLVAQIEGNQSLNDKIQTADTFMAM